MPPCAAGHAGGRPPASARGPAVSPPGPCETPYGIGRIDASGRVSDRAVICALGWRGGDRLTLTAGGGVVVARRDPHGMVDACLPRPQVVIPAALRRRCGLAAR